MTRRGRRNVANGVAVFGVFLLTATLLTALGADSGDSIGGAFGGALVAGGWLWRDRFD